MINLPKEDCCGCGACKAICPRKAITLSLDSEGFWYPLINQDVCVNCGLCQKTCPSINVNESCINKTKAVGCKNTNVEEQLNSASGGIFTVIAKCILKKKGIVFGAKFRSDWNVEHGFIQEESELDSLCRSKYVQSDASNSYPLVKDFLLKEKNVLFTGTPCQCLALRRFLRKDYDNLVVVDIVCHGVPSPKIWQQYLNEESEKIGCSVSEIEEIRFKYKEKDKYHWKHPGFLIKWKNGKLFKIFSNKTSYENGFLTNLFTRPSCAKCKMKPLASSSDLTIGDFWGVEKVYPDFMDKNGVSILFINTKIGELIYHEIQSQLLTLQISVEDAVHFNARVTKSITMNKKRDMFFELVSNRSVDYSVNECLKKSLWEKTKNNLHLFKAKLSGLIK